MPPGADPLPTAVAICEAHGRAPEALLEILLDLQAALGFVPEATLPTIAAELNIARAEVHGVASFYHDLRFEPAAGPTVQLCRAEACQAMGADALWDAATEALAARAEFAPVYCLGLCALAPAAAVAGRPIGRASVERLADALTAEVTS